MRPKREFILIEGDSVFYLIVLSTVVDCIFIISFRFTCYNKASKTLCELDTPTGATVNVTAVLRATCPVSGSGIWSK